MVNVRRSCQKKVKIPAPRVMTAAPPIKATTSAKGIMLVFFILGKGVLGFQIGTGTGACTGAFGSPWTGATGAAGL